MKTIVVPSAGKQSGFTLLFEVFVIDVLQAAQNIQIAAMLMVYDWSTAQVIMQRPVTRGLERRSVDEVSHVGIDEKGLRKGQHYVTVRTVIDQSRILDVTPDRQME